MTVADDSVVVCFVAEQPVGFFVDLVVVLPVADGKPVVVWLVEVRHVVLHVY